MSCLFAQFVAGYTGRSVDRRGGRLEDGPLWSLPELQELLDEWIVAVWQNRPHDALRDARAPKRAFSPNEKYAMLLESCGYVPVPLNGEDYVELLPERWQAINASGIRINHRTYDGAELNPLRRRRSGVVEKNGLWGIHHAPYDVSRVWVRDRRGERDRWITVFWRHLHRVGVPFGEMAWDHARQQVPGGNEAPAGHDRSGRGAADGWRRSRTGGTGAHRGRGSGIRRAEQAHVHGHAAGADERPPGLDPAYGDDIDTVLAVRLEGGLITGLYAVRNPEKLSRIDRETAVGR